MRLPKDLEATSLLALGMKGAIDGEAFTLSGRRAVQGHRGGIWNEWTLRFAQSRGARPPLFLSESAGTFTLYSEGTLLPSLDELVVGELAPSKWIVVERGTAKRLAKWGDLEEAPASYEYADLAAQTGDGVRRATMAEGEIFIGEHVEASALGLLPRREPPALVPAPDVSCPSGLEVWLDVGDSGDLDGVHYTVLGMVARSRVAEAEPTSEATADEWQEYLLYAPGVGLRWLAVGNGHWSYAASVPNGVTWRSWMETAPPQRARVDWATGELPWSVEIGELSFLCEKEPFSAEWTPTDITWSAATDVSPDDVSRAFGKRALPVPK